MTNQTNITNLLTQASHPRIGMTASLPYRNAQLFPLLAVGDSVQIGCFSGQVSASTIDRVAIDGYIPNDAEAATEGPFLDPNDEERYGTLGIELGCSYSKPELPEHGKLHFARIGAEAHVGRLRGRVVGIGEFVEVRVSITPEDLALIHEAAERARRRRAQP